jgi:hypothetical protein
VCSNNHVMIGTEHRHKGRGNPSLAQLERDAALGRLSRARRWLIVGATAATAAIAAGVSAAAPGHKVGARAETEGASLSSDRMPAPASPAELGLQSPQSAPQPAPAPVPPAAAPAPAPSPAPVSGGS